MIFVETSVKGAYVIEIEPVHDERGFFARTWCERELAERGLNPVVKQSSVSFNKRRGTLRGMHYQVAPHEETKIVSCPRGAIHDVVLDLRRESPTYKRHVALELSADNRKMVYIPIGCAHGFQTLLDNTEVDYRISTPYVPEAARGVRFDDPAFGIQWPSEPRIVSERDRSYPDFEDS